MREDRSRHATRPALGKPRNKTAKSHKRRGVAKRFVRNGSPAVSPSTSETWLHLQIKSEVDQESLHQVVKKKLLYLKQGKMTAKEFLSKLDQTLTEYQAA